MVEVVGILCGGDGWNGERGEEQRRRKLSMILVTHDERIASRCERIVHMKDGRIV
mgnify:CR=1 FL=1